MINLENLPVDDYDEIDNTEFEIDPEQTIKPEPESELGPELASDILKRSRELMKTINDDIKLIEAKLRNFQGELIMGSRPFQEVNEDIRINEIEKQRLVEEKDKISEDARLRIIEIKKSRGNLDK